MAQASKQSSNEMSQDTKALITILLVLFLPPVGVILMWAWMKSWPTWLKILLTLFGFGGLILIGVLLFGAMGWGLFAVVNQGMQCENVCKLAPDKHACIVSCNTGYNSNPKAVISFSSDILLTALNKDREGRGSDVGPLAKDNNLCLYAEKLAQNYKDSSKAPQDTLDKDLYNPAVNSQFFYKFSHVYQQQVETVNFSTHDLPVEFRDYRVATRRALLTHGCFAVIPSNKPNSSIIQFVGAIAR